VFLAIAVDNLGDAEEADEEAEKAAAEAAAAAAAAEKQGENNVDVNTYRTVAKRSSFNFRTTLS